MYFDNDFINKVLDRADIVEVVGEFVNLKRAGVNYKGLCPFHNERTPSFVVSPAKGIFKCFGCGEAGNAVSFLMKHEKFSFAEAIKWLANKYNIPIEEKELTGEEKRNLEERDSLLIITDLAGKYYKDLLFNNPEGKAIGYEYFKNRGFTDETIRKFDLGYSLESFKSFTDYALSKGFKLEILEKAGLTIVKDNDYYDRFRGRVMFPVHSLGGKILGFAGRILKKEKSPAKYINSPETSIYQKRRILYGLHLAKKEIVRNDKCYLVEGYTDVISMHQAGVKNVVAASGTSLTEEQVILIRRFTQNITLVFDGDAAGLKAAIRGTDIVLKQGMNVKIIVLPPDEDPDSFTRKYPLSDVLEFFRTKEEDFIKFKISLLLNETGNDPVKKANSLASIAKSISVIPDKVKRDLYVKETSILMNIPEDGIIALINKYIFQERKKNFYKTSEQTPQVRKSPVIPENVTSFDISHEKEVLYFLLNFGNREFDIIKTDFDEKVRTVADFIITELQNDNLEFTNLNYKKLFEEYEKLLLENKNFDENYFLKHPDENINRVATELLTENFVSTYWNSKEDPAKYFDTYYKVGTEKAVYNFKRKILLKEIENLKQMLKEPENYENITEIMKTISLLQAKVMELTPLIDNRVVF